MNFQYNETMKWCGKPTEAHVIIPPISPHNKATNSGAAKDILSLLILYGIFESTSSNALGDEPEITKLPLDSNSNECYLLMVGDGLTQIKVKQFSDIIDETSSLYGPYHKVTVMLQKALDQVIFIPGNLHGGGFHIMQVV